MQTWIIDKDFQKNAQLLDSKRSNAQIYEGIHVLASLLEINDTLYGKDKETGKIIQKGKRSVANHPIAQMWKGYEISLFNYIMCFIAKSKKSATEYKETINGKNILLCIDSLIKKNYNTNNPKWICDRLINQYRSNLIAKNPEYYKKIWPNINPDTRRLYYNTIEGWYYKE